VPLSDRLDYVVMCCAGLHDVIVNMDPERSVWCEGLG